jgi:conjugal transfer pilus assembly protein TraA
MKGGLSMTKYLKVFLPIMAIMLIGIAANVFAGVNGTEFQSVETALYDWSQGGLGRALALTIFLVGMGVGIARQSLMAVASGLGGGLALFYLPDVINLIVAATIV